MHDAASVKTVIQCLLYIGPVVSPGTSYKTKLKIDWVDANKQEQCRFTVIQEVRHERGDQKYNASGFHPCNLHSGSSEFLKILHAS